MRTRLGLMAVAGAVLIAGAGTWFAPVHGDPPTARKPQWQYRILSGAELEVIAGKHQKEAERLLDANKGVLDTPGLDGGKKLEDFRRQAALNEVGAEGWELAGISAEDREHIRYVFKRAE
jgi:hypothetical protein